MPPARLGALLALWLFHYKLNVIAMIGILLLILIVKKNAIMVAWGALKSSNRKF